MTQIVPSMLDAYISCCVGRRSDFAVQRADGRYSRVGSLLTSQEIFAHVQGARTVGTYVIDEHGLCHFAVYDSDDPTNGLVTQLGVQQALAAAGIVSYLELSRRGPHVWVFLAQPAAPALVRAFLLPYCPAGVEFYPKQDEVTREHSYGSLIRLPLGVHRLSGERYPFVVVENGQVVPLMSSLLHGLAWFQTVQRVTVPADLVVTTATQRTTRTTKENTLQPVVSSPITSRAPWLTIRGWCLARDPLEVIGRYVELGSNGLGHCPFGWHHDDGVDSRPSLWVHRLSAPSDLCCWYCHTWQQGGSLFDFLRYYYNLDARELWRRLLLGGQF